MKNCYKSDGTRETGARIIKELERQGGVNSRNMNGMDSGHYYFILDKKIRCRDFYPSGYTLSELPKEDYKMKKRYYFPFMIGVFLSLNDRNVNSQPTWLLVLWAVYQYLSVVIPVVGVFVVTLFC